MSPHSLLDLHLPWNPGNWIQFEAQSFWSFLVIFLLDNWAAQVWNDSGKRTRKKCLELTRTRQKNNNSNMIFHSAWSEQVATFNLHERYLLKASPNPSKNCLFVSRSQVTQDCSHNPFARVSSSVLLRPGQLPTQGGRRPIKACGYRWYPHKHDAIFRSSLLHGRARVGFDDPTRTRLLFRKRSIRWAGDPVIAIAKKSPRNRHL